MGETIEHLDLIGADGRNINAASLEKNTHILVIFDTPCSKCNKNLPIWNKLAVLSKGTDVKVHGIVPDEPGKAVKFAETKAAIFDIYSPVDLETFRADLRVRINLPQTIVYQDGKIKYISLGLLGRDGYVKIKAFLEEKQKKKK
ncbi:MAG: redoxin domain-containing protein, partial [bacterium]|nr:redoxin domain-containing protein [bacterium]